MKFNYFYKSESQNEIDLESLGNFALLARNDSLEHYILIASTRLGITHIFKYGPFVPDINEMCKIVNCTYKKINFNAMKMQKMIKEFLNNPFTKITQVELIDKMEAIKMCSNIVTHFEDILIENGDDDVNELAEELLGDEEN